MSDKFKNTHPLAQPSESMSCACHNTRCSREQDCKWYKPTAWRSFY